MSKLPSKLEDQLLKIVKQGFKDELKFNTKIHHRNGLGAPLSAWMLGASKFYKSKIIAVTTPDGARYPYTSIGHGAKVLSNRIANRYKVTWIQHSLIERYVLSRYRGQISVDSQFRKGEYSELLNPKNTSEKTQFALDFACEKINQHIHDLPLRVLIDQRVTNILLLIELNEQTKQLKRSSKNGRKPNDHLRRRSPHDPRYDCCFAR